MIRTTTRVCHSKSAVSCGERGEAPVKAYKKNPAKNLMVPAHAKQRRVVVEQRMKDLAAYTESTPFNYIEGDGTIGVIVSGMCYHYAKEVFGNTVRYLKLGFTNPLPDKLLAKF